MKKINIILLLSLAIVNANVYSASKSDEGKKQYVDISDIESELTTELEQIKTGFVDQINICLKLVANGENLSLEELVKMQHQLEPGQKKYAVWLQKAKDHNIDIKKYDEAFNFIKTQFVSESMKLAPDIDWPKLMEAINPARKKLNEVECRVQ